MVRKRSLDSVNGRIIVTFGANFIKSILTFFVGITLARLLGPTDYGQYAFLLAVFLSFRSLMEMGTSNAFFTFLSQRSRSKQFYHYYFSWVLIQFALPVIIILCLPEVWLENLFKSNNLVLVVAAFVASFTQQTLWNAVVQVGESHRLTIDVQVCNVAIAAVHFLFVISFYWVNHKSLISIYLLIAAEVVLAILCLKVVWRDKLKLSKADELLGVNQFVSEFWEYCKPLIPFAWVSFAYSFVDAWLLRHFGGAEEQAFYTIAAQLSAISLIATTSVMKIFWKEVAEAQHLGNEQRVYHLFTSIGKRLYLFAAAVSGMLIPWSEELVLVMLGEAYLGGVAALGIMLFYPVHQSMGQLVGSMFYAIEKTRTYVSLGLIFMLVSIAFAFFILLPESSYGLGMGSEGLAVKMVIAQIVSVNVGLYLLYRIKGWRFTWFYQIVTLSLMLMGGWSIKEVVVLILSDDLSNIVKFLVSGSLYVFYVGAAIFAFPNSTLGLSRNNLKQRLNGLLKIREARIK